MQSRSNSLTLYKMDKLARNTYIYQIMQWLKSGRSITSKQAIDEFGCTRLSAVIFRLVNEYGLPVAKTMVSVRNRNGRRVDVASYYLAEVLAC